MHDIFYDAPSVRWAVEPSVCLFLSLLGRRSSTTFLRHVLGASYDVYPTLIIHISFETLAFTL